ncbi:MAG TPA: MOSC domain-containing protein [Mycobacteriales bacterium]|jgi:MOSC domain-containing protein YiiM|nr:MOSC domain-containing protein [Mycobacteriales bacterium]
MSSGTVLSVSRDGSHRFSKPVAPEITLIAGIGVAGDAHAGETVQHRSRVAADPSQPNLRQVHLIHSELHDELRDQGFEVAPGQLGENVTTSGIDLLGLPRGTILSLGEQAVIEITGLRNPCGQINGLQTGLMKAVLGRDADGEVIRKAGVMAVVVTGGPVRPGDPITLTFPDGPHRSLASV